MDTDQTQFVIQDFHYKFFKIKENGESLWKKINFDKNRIVWLS